jgi:asparagine synthase (glutamine-hydrolysing)
MCGIVGIAVTPESPAPDRELLERMCDSLAHRGPDDASVDVRNGVGLGIRRLAIIDVAGGKQPYFNEDGTVRAVFNGEIYNFGELREQLQNEGHRFNSRADGEVIVHLWEKYGVDFPKHLNGMFAIAVHDARRRALLLVRDRLGIKPLYYLRTSSALAFGSELKALLEYGSFDRRLNLDAVAAFLAWEYVPFPSTLLEGVRKLAPGAQLLVELDSLEGEVVQWWTIPPPRSTGSETRSRLEWGDAVAAKLRESVQRRLVADVPLGAFLSGGVDSSLIVAAMGSTTAFSIGFDDPSYSELEWARRVARHLGVEHRTEVIHPKAVELFDRLMHFMDDPIGDFSIFPTYLVSRVARDGVTVALSGDGGDELFGGYETYAAQHLAKLWNRVPSFLRRGLIEKGIRRLRPRPEKKGLVNKARRFVEGLGYDEKLAHARWRVFLEDALRSSLFTHEAAEAMSADWEAHVHRLFAEAGARAELDRSLFVDVRSYLTDNCLVKVDRMSMACSLEVRVPFLDHELVELAFSVPPEFKLSRGRTKPLLKQIAASQVPRECVYRAKEGFSIPMKHWLRAEFRPLLEELLDEKLIADGGVFRPEAIRRLMDEHQAAVANHSHILWSLLVFQDWRERWRI